MKINKIATNIRVTDAADIGGKLYGELDTAPVDDPLLVVIKGEIQTVNTALTNALNEYKAMSVLEDLDTKRDNTYRAIMYLNKGYLLHPDATIRNAALEVEKVMERYGFELINQNYTTQSTLTEAFIRDMKETAMAAHVAVLPGLTNLVEQLGTVQEQFRASESTWHAAQNADDKTVSASTLKRELLKVVNDKLVVYLRAMMQMNPEPYNDISLSIANHINQANALVKRRKNSEEKADATN